MKKEWKKRAAALGALSAFLTASALPAGAAWVENGGQYSYVDENGNMAADSWQFIDGEWYRFDADGQMVTGWFTDTDGQTYYLNEEGAMARHWAAIGGDWYVFDSSGHPLSGWYWSGKYWYYLEDGKMLTGQWIGDSYYVTDEGMMAKGFLTLDGVTHFFKESGEMSRSWVSYDGNWYYFGPSGEMQTGWLLVDGSRYFADSQGRIQTGLIEIDGTVCRFDEDGMLLESGASGTPEAAFSGDGSREIAATGEQVTIATYGSYSAFRIGELLEEYGVCTADDFVEAANEYHPFLYNDAIPDGLFIRYEGYLSPGTYTFTTGQSAGSVVETMLMRFEETVDAEMVQQLADAGYTLHEAVTFASILQSEAGGSPYRYQISAVFQNRLQSDDYPKMQSNPTRTYAETYIEPVDPQLAAQYDTYQCNGLPAGPINNPDQTAFDTLLNPDPDCDAFYFVSDGEGNVYFSETLEEHNAYIAMIRDKDAEEAEETDEESRSALPHGDAD